MATSSLIARCRSIKWRSAGYDDQMSLRTKQEIAIFNETFAEHLPSKLFELIAKE
jgi:hypothetical protein